MRYFEQKRLHENANAPSNDSFRGRHIIEIQDTLDNMTSIMLANIHILRAMCGNCEHISGFKCTNLKGGCRSGEMRKAVDRYRAILEQFEEDVLSLCAERLNSADT